MTSMAELLEREREKRQWTIKAMGIALGVGNLYKDWIHGRPMTTKSIQRCYLILGLDPDEVINATFAPYKPTFYVPKGGKLKKKVIDQPWAK